MIFKSFTHEKLQFKNRFVMPGMTRIKGDSLTGVPTDLMKTYYVQRAQSAGLIITESIPINRMANAQPGAGALWSDECIKKWKEIVDEVHKQDTVFFAQLNHPGRLAHSDVLPNGQSPISSTTVAAPGETNTPSGKKPNSNPKIATHEQIKEILQDYKLTAQNALKAGFDGVEVNAGTGLLLDQFLSPKINLRDDEYNGPIENRARLLLEIIDQVTQVYPPTRVGVKLSVTGRSAGTGLVDPKKDLKYLLTQFNNRNLGFANLVEAEKQDVNDEAYIQIPNVAKEARANFKGLIITNGYKTVEERIKAVEDGDADFAAFGKLHICNPDLSIRLKNNWPLNEFSWANIFAKGERGYVDWPFYQPEEQQVTPKL